MQFASLARYAPVNDGTYLRFGEQFRTKRGGGIGTLFAGRCL
jgi:hypothetical protein